MVPSHLHAVMEAGSKCAILSKKVEIIDAVEKGGKSFTAVAKQFDVVKSTVTCRARGLSLEAHLTLQFGYCVLMQTPTS